MLSRIIAVGVVAIALMGAVKDGRLPRAVGLTGSCTALETTTSGIRFEACRPGRLDGAPSLSGAGCTPAGTAGRLAYWRCPPQPLVRKAAGR
jgi:hypothetical protein